MSIFYSLIAKSFDVVLCEYTEYLGNFQQITRILLRNIKKNTKMTIDYDKYKYHFINENDITYLCMSENYSNELALAYLRDVQKIFIQTYDNDKIAAFCAYQLTDFDKILSQLMTYYNKEPKITKTGDIIKDLFKEKTIEIENVNRILERNEKLNVIAIKPDNLNTQSKNITIMAQQIKKQVRMKHMKNIILFGGAAVLIIFLLFYLLN